MLHTPQSLFIYGMHYMYDIHHSLFSYMTYDICMTYTTQSHFIYMTHATCMTYTIRALHILRTLCIAYITLCIAYITLCIAYTATHCNTLQHTATHCNTLQHTATHYNTLQHTALHILHILQSLCIEPAPRERGGCRAGWSNNPSTATLLKWSAVPVLQTCCSECQ